MDEGVDRQKQGGGRTRDDVMNRGFVHDDQVLVNVTFCLSNMLC